jgi:hypothetical protein
MRNVTAFRQLLVGSRRQQRRRVKSGATERIGPWNPLNAMREADSSEQQTDLSYQLPRCGARGRVAGSLARSWEPALVFERLRRSRCGACARPAAI